jgi:hypothetical protein
MRKETIGTIALRTEFAWFAATLSAHLFQGSMPATPFEDRWCHFQRFMFR